eukprot:TRINITY_DN1184_c0_g1_i1.p1 TRINITY_DN1184_c0_g1~~TRINITY_DN1184_c0_g1_i1.p1  ORF type:complete len:304 (-),score=56.73 TRINITY_DN1184_c0_g1_i1:76-936(-)
MKLPVALCVFLTVCSSHTIWKYPLPRSSTSGKEYPCPDPFWQTGDPHTTLKPGIVTLEWEEYINHKGAPYRVALSYGDDNKFDDWILLDHVPHQDSSGKNTYSFQIEIPNINCPRCSLQIINPMTDKENGRCCDYPNQKNESRCSSVYHSCANIVIEGVNDPATFNHTRPPVYSYAQESAEWTEVDSTFWFVRPETTKRATCRGVPTNSDIGFYGSVTQVVPETSAINIKNPTALKAVLITLAVLVMVAVIGTVIFIYRKMIKEKLWKQEQKNYFASLEDDDDEGL